MRYILALFSAVAIVAVTLFVWAERHPAIAPIEAPAKAAFDRTLVAKGQVLTALGNCAVCHTRRGGKAFAGGLVLPTPFGTIHSTNITPDPATGIGRWSEAAFSRALREGISREGNYLYPAFPYTHFTKVTDADIKAIYAFLMTRTPVKAVTPPNGLVFPVNHRIVMAGWNFLFLKPGPFAPDPSKSAAWNRGAYLAEGLGHCGLCHTPLNLFGAEKRSQLYAGGEAENWHAPALSHTSPSSVPWTEESLVNFLIDGWDKDHGVAAGPMTAVVNELANVPESDVRSIATYLLSFQDRAGSKERAAAAIAFAAEREFSGMGKDNRAPTVGHDPSYDNGQMLFAKVCANCHHAGGQTVPLALTTSVNGPDARNLIHVVQEGIRPPEGAAERSMPAFGGSLSNANFADLVAFVRAHFSNQPRWIDVPQRIQEIRSARD